MKLSAEEGLRALILLSLGIIAFDASSTVALTVPTTAPIELVRASDVLPNLFTSLNATSLNVTHYESNCAPSDNDEAWYSGPKEQKWRYDNNCYEAMRLFHKEQQRYDAAEFEFLAPEAKPSTQLKKMQTPRRYTFGTPSTFCS